MSSIYFHTKSAGTVGISGRERAHFGILTRYVANALIGYSFDFPNSPDNPKPFSHHDDGRFGELCDRVLALNSDPLSLCARLHATCEAWAWVADENRAWLADIVEQGRRSEVLRPGMGWEELVELLRQPNVGPVVTSYSVTDQFPGYYCPMPGAGVGRFIAEDTWARLSEDERWDQAFAWLSAQPASSAMGVELNPDTWRTWRVRN